MSKYRTDIETLAEAFKALSNPNRLQIFLQLMNCCEPGTECSTDMVASCCVGELGEELSVAPSTLSHHIKELARAGLIRTHRNGKNVECAIDLDKIILLKEFFDPTGSIQCCAPAETPGVKNN